MNLVDASTRNVSPVLDAVKSAAAHFQADLAKLREELDDPVAKEAVDLAMLRLSQRASLPGAFAEILAGPPRSEPQKQSEQSLAAPMPAPTIDPDLSFDAIIARRNAQTIVSRIAASSAPPAKSADHGWGKAIERVNARTASRHGGRPLADGRSEIASNGLPSQSASPTSPKAETDGWSKAFAKAGLTTKGEQLAGCGWGRAIARVNETSAG